MEDLPTRIKNKLQDTILLIDYYLFKTRDIFKKTPVLKNPSRILVVEIAGIGDTIGATPVITALKQHYPESRIDILTSILTKSILLNHPDISNILVYDKNTLPQIKNKYSLAVLLASGSKKIGKLLKDANIPFRIGCTKRGATQGKGFYLTKKARPLKGITHTIENNLNVLRTIGITATENIPRIYSTKKEDQAIENLLKKHKITKKDFMTILSPGSKNIEKIKNHSHKWQEENFAELGDYLTEKLKSKVIIITSRQEKNLAEQINSLMKNKSLIFTNLSLREVMAMIKRANLVIAIDSGPMHIAEALNTPLIALFGPQNPKRWRPLSKNSTYVYNNDVCNGCQKYICKRKSNICMSSITVGNIIKKIKEILL
ncbi:MAG: glycosyltransferase family 9 protein [Nanoarchaeota archaeon]|nr:glycosyltransferase family 9 protein [Nanoarchaeota archaeon]